MSEEDKGEWPRTGIYATFTVESVDETMEWYQRMLGWQVGKDAFDEEGNCTFGSVIYSIMLSTSLGEGRSRRTLTGTS